MEEKKEQKEETTEKEPESKEETEVSEEKQEDTESTTSEENTDERTPVENVVSESVNSGFAKQLTDLDRKLDTILILLGNSSPNLNESDVEQKTKDDDKTSKAELEALENLLE